MIKLPLEPQRYTPLLIGEKIRLVFIFQGASFWPSWESLYYSCKNDDSVDARLVFIEKTCLETAQMANAKSFLIQNKLDYCDFDSFDFAEFKAHAVVYQTPYEPDHREPNAWSKRMKMYGSRVIYVPYGIEISDSEASRRDHFKLAIFNNCWRIYTISDGMKAEYHEHCPNHHAVRSVGVPKLDGLYCKEKYALSEDILDKAHGRRTVLIKVHYPRLISQSGKTVQLTPYIDEYIKFVSMANNYEDTLFVLCAHPKFFDERVDEANRSKARQLIDICENMPNIYVDKSDDYRNSLLNVDAIIIDRSALMVEAAANGCPVLFMSNADFYEPMTKPVKQLVDSYYQGTTAKDMCDFMTMLARGSDDKKTERTAAMSGCYQYFDGKCADRIKNDIVASIKEETAAPQTKIDLVLFGLGVVCEHFTRTTGILHDERYNIIAVCDNDMAKHGTIWNGKTVVSPESLWDLKYDYIAIISDTSYTDIAKTLVWQYDIGIEKILRLEDFAMDVIKCR